MLASRKSSGGCSSSSPIRFFNASPDNPSDVARLKANELSSPKYPTDLKNSSVLNKILLETVLSASPYRSTALPTAPLNSRASLEMALVDYVSILMALSRIGSSFMKACIAVPALSSSECNLTAFFMPCNIPKSCAENFWFVFFSLY